MNEMLDHSAFETSLTNVKMAYRRADVTFFSCMIDLVYVSRGRVSDRVAVECSSIYPFQRGARISEVPIKYDRTEPQLRNANTECNICRCFAKEERYQY